MAPKSLRKKRRPADGGKTGRHVRAPAMVRGWTAAIPRDTSCTPGKSPLPDCCSAPHEERTDTLRPTRRSVSPPLPDYLARRGTPRNPQELSNHDCIVLRTLPAPLRWPFCERGRESFVDIKSRVLVDSGEAALRLAIAGCGITRLADLMASEAIVERFSHAPWRVSSHTG